MDSDQVDWLVEQVDALLDWDLPVGRPRALPLDTALVMVLFGLRHNLASDVLGEVFGCGSTTVERYREEVEPLVDDVLTPLYERVRDPARRDAVLVDGLVVPVGERDDVDGLFSEKKGFCGQNVQVVANLAGRVVDVGDPCPGVSTPPIGAPVSSSVTVPEPWMRSRTC
ncbi:transposase family protein [Micromonospora sp. LOL_027]|uniref:transposase family protein n=1 Tax=Micromonospora sp. LOL_027 TaxID=3345419 RepID=UPI003A861961